MISTQRYYAWAPGVAFPRYGTLPWGGSAYHWTVVLRHSTGAGIRKRGVERTLATLFHKVRLRGITRVRSLWFGQRESETLKGHSCDFRDRASPL
jgi:hypothetical protein